MFSRAAVAVPCEGYPLGENHGGAPGRSKEWHQEWAGINLWCLVDRMVAQLGPRPTPACSDRVLVCGKEELRPKREGRLLVRRPSVVGDRGYPGQVCNPESPSE